MHWISTCFFVIFTVPSELSVRFSCERMAGTRTRAAQYMCRQSRSLPRLSFGYMSLWYNENDNVILRVIHILRNYVLVERAFFERSWVTRERLEVLQERCHFMRIMPHDFLNYPPHNTGNYIHEPAPETISCVAETRSSENSQYTSRNRLVLRLFHSVRIITETESSRFWHYILLAAKCSELRTTRNFEAGLFRRAPFGLLHMLGSSHNDY